MYRFLGSPCTFSGFLLLLLQSTPNQLIWLTAKWFYSYPTLHCNCIDGLVWISRDNFSFVMPVSDFSGKLKPISYNLQEQISRAGQISSCDFLETGNWTYKQKVKLYYIKLQVISYKYKFGAYKLKLDYTILSYKL